MKRLFALTIASLLTLSLMPGYANAATTASSTAATAETQTLTPAPIPSLTAAQLSKLFRVYTIEHDDCLISIGRRFGIQWRYIADLNGISGPRYTIITGQTLKIPLKPKLPGTTGNYLILCETEAQKQCLANFAAFKAWSGYTVTVKSVEADVKPGADADASAGIQQYLKKMDQELALEYVLLIGNPYNSGKCCPKHTGGIIPMRYLYAEDNYYKTSFNYHSGDYHTYNMPSDIYYAFDFNWDGDGDGWAGELKDYNTKTVKPRLMFLLGRIPFSDSKDITTMLNATMQYELNQKPHSAALIGSREDWTFYGDALAKNLQLRKVESTTFFDNSGKNTYKCTYPLSDDIFGREASKMYDIVYTVDGTPDGMDWYNFHPANVKGITTGLYFMDGTATMEIEDARPMAIQDFLANGSICAAIATTRQIGYNPDDPFPRMASLLFTSKTRCVSRAFYDAEQSLILGWNWSEKYNYCYLGDPSITLKP